MTQEQYKIQVNETLHLKMTFENSKVTELRQKRNMVITNQLLAYIKRNKQRKVIQEDRKYYRMHLIDSIIYDDQEDEEEERELAKVKEILDQEIQNEKKNEESKDGKEQQCDANQTKQKLKSTMSIMIDQEKQKKQEKKKAVLKQLKKILNFLSSINMSIEEYINNQVFSVEPYQKKYSREFILLCKQGNYYQIEKCLTKNKYLVYDFDYCFGTGLHWAVKREHVHCIQLIIDAGADINQQDILGRNALFFAIETQNMQIIRLLLYNKANPWTNSKILMNFQMEIPKKIKKILSQARKIDILMKMQDHKQRNAFWKSQRYTLL